MGAKGIAVDVLLALAVLIALASSLGVLVMPDPYRKLHYLTPMTIVAPVLVGLAVLVRSGWSTNSAQTWLALLLVAMATPYVSHATVRAARIKSDRDSGGRRSNPESGTAKGER